MKLVIIEPLGVEEEKLMEIAHKALPDSVEIVSYQTKVTDTESLIERGKDADIIMVANLPLNAEVIKGCKNLKMLAVAFTGIDHIAMDACKEQGITVCNCAGYSNAAVSDLVFGLLISLYRNIISCDQVVREEGTKDGLVGFELEGKKFGVIGTGAIGTRVAKIAQAFGCEVYGIDHIAMDACKEQGITVCNCAGYSNAAVSDLVFGLLISLYRNIISCDQVVREEGTKDGLVGFELEGKKFGVIGTGAIGTRVAKIAQAFGCEVYAYSRTVKDLPGIQFVGLEELLYNCDIISLHVPLNESTKGLIGKDEIALMKPDAVLINTARGPVVDSEALAEALNNGKIAGAAVDVFENEPPVSKDHPLLHAKNLIATPHVAFATKEALVKRAIIDFDNVKCWMEGKPVNVMN